MMFIQNSLEGDRLLNNDHSTIKIITVPSASLDISGSSNLTSCRTDARCFLTFSIITEPLDPSQHSNHAYKVFLLKIKLD